VKTSKGPVTNIWRIDGTVLSGWPQVQDRTARNDFGGYNQNIGIADLDGDGMKDIVSTYDICHIGIMRSDGSEFTASGFFKGKYASSVPMFHDIALAAQGWGVMETTGMSSQIHRLFLQMLILMVYLRLYCFRTMSVPESIKTGETVYGY
jgi:hypothetical protein